MKMKLAALLRRMADRLAPVPAGDCGSGSMSIDFGPYASGGLVASFSGNQLIETGPGFEGGNQFPAINRLEFGPWTETTP